MATGRRSDFTLPTFDDIFSTQEQRDEAKLAKIRDIPINLLCLPLLHWLLLLSASQQQVALLFLAKSVLQEQ